MSYRDEIQVDTIHPGNIWFLTYSLPFQTSQQNKSEVKELQ